MTEGDNKIIVAMIEKAEGNESIGTMWVETALFSPDMPIKEVMAWAERETHTHDSKPRGKLMLRYANDQRYGRES